jgi:hypothetical protein
MPVIKKQKQLEIKREILVRKWLSVKLNQLKVERLCLIKDCSIKQVD